MPSPSETFYSMKRLHAMFAVASLAMLAATVWMVAADHGREWKRYQRVFRDQIEPWATEAALQQQELDDRPDERDRLERTLAQQRPSFGKWFLSLPFIDAFGRPLAIEQVWLPDLQINYNFCQVARFDRCTTCHQGIDKTMALEIRRGLPHPYSTHPRLDLYVGSRSPHPLPEFGCTICHEGQGSATEFKFASHSPNDPDQRARWRKEHGWFWNHDWDFPMRPKRFLQSNCLRCHHEVADLEPGTRFADPPAPKLLEGYHLVRQLGCFGCHELNGFGEAGQRIGPDMRLEPNDHEAALGLLADPGLDPEQRRLAGQVAAQPDDASKRRQLASLLRGSSRLRRESQTLVGILAAESPSPGVMRKVGPSLRDVAGRLDAAGIAAWIGDPAGFRPTTRMPQLFGMHEHLDVAGLEVAQRFEPVEIRAMTEYLLSASQPVASAEPPAGITEAPSVERGKRFFRVQGCLACHRHKDFPEAQSTQGKDLSRVGAMFRGPNASKWLTSWIRDPARHSSRTLMPNSLLEPVPIAGAQAGKPRLADPAADIAAYLMASKDWEPKALPPLVEADLDELALLYLSKTYAREAAKYVREGIPASMAGEIPPDAAELLGPITPENKIGRKLRYVGRRTIRKRGCFGCHDVPAVEDAQGIGPALSDWGRKQQSQLAFEQVAQFLAEKGDAASFGAAIQAIPSRAVSARRGAANEGLGDTSRADTARLGVSDLSPFSAADRAFYREAIRSNRREGFIWQKLRAPRSFDFQKTADKPYNEHLLMGKFALTDAQREAIITFMLGLVAEPPKSRYVFQPDERGKAIVEGRKVLDRYGCAQCHTMEMERWTIEYDPARFPAPPPMPEHEFIQPAIGQDRLAASQKTDRRGLCRAELMGMPQVNAEGKPEETEDDDGNPQYAFTLWEPAVIAGKVWPVGGAGVLVSPGQIAAKRPPRGGDFARLLYPTAVAEAKAAGSAAAATEAWGWVPPALAHEGRIVQPAWLYEYLLDPSVIRPAAVLRMPKFTLSPAQSRKLVDYFAAVAGVEFPYSSDPRARTARREPATAQESERLKRAMRFVTDRTTYCAKCHLVGDFSPGGEIRTTLAPNLQDVAGRIRPEYLRRWLASPKSVLPYTAMPVNFPSDQQLGQEIYPGSSVEQLDAVMDLLLNYDGYVRSRVSIQQLIEAGTKGK